MQLLGHRDQVDYTVFTIKINGSQLMGHDQNQPLLPMCDFQKVVYCVNLGQKMQWKHSSMQKGAPRASKLLGKL